MLTFCEGEQRRCKVLHQRASKETLPLPLTIKKESTLVTLRRASEEESGEFSESKSWSRWSRREREREKSQRWRTSTRVG